MNRLKEYMNESSKDEIYAKIMDFFADNPSPPDKDVHALANKLGIDEHKFEGYIYAILGSILGTGEAKKKGFAEKDADRNELALGIKAEMEHTKNKAISKRIALDHLAELPDYYTRLMKMEKKGE